jgi:CHASE3 domain sensor protein
MKQQGNNSPSKANYTTKGLNNRKEKEISNIGLQKILVRMINEFKETQKLVSDFKEDMNKQLNELKDNTNKQMNEINNTMQDMEKENDKDMEILRNNYVK